MHGPGCNFGHLCLLLFFVQKKKKKKKSKIFLTRKKIRDMVWSFKFPEKLQTPFSTKKQKKKENEIYYLLNCHHLSDVVGIFNLSTIASNYNVCRLVLSQGDGRGNYEVSFLWTASVYKLVKWHYFNFKRMPEKISA